MAGRPVQKGTNELTLGELHQLLEPETHQPTTISALSDVQSLAINYHARWALAAAPLVLAFFAFALTRRRQWGRVMPLLAGCLTVLGYFVAMDTARGFGLDRTLSAFGAAWTPNLVVLIVAVAVMKLRSTLANKASGV